jgi:HrpA-like RNA helicase
MEVGFSQANERQKKLGADSSLTKLTGPSKKRKPDVRLSEGTFSKKERKAVPSNDVKSLPVYQYELEIINSVKNHQVTIIVGETGSGKSTQIPQILLDHQVVPDNKCIVCTQPRRVAAVTIAQKVASERNTSVGREVGYSIRFEDKSSPMTKIKYVTDGVLLREFMSDPVISHYNIVLLDEAHERSLQTDILMGLLKQIQEQKTRDPSNFKILIMSATLQIELFTQFFSDANVVTVPGRQYPVAMYYTPEPEQEFIDAALITCLQIHEEEENGGVLVFLPGQEEIESLTQLLYENLPLTKGHASLDFERRNNNNNNNSSSSHSHKSLEEDNNSKTITEEKDGSKTVNIDNLRDYDIRPLYAAMPPEEQLRVFEPSPAGKRKFILSTNIAETSVTISGVKYGKKNK